MCSPQESRSLVRTKAFINDDFLGRDAMDSSMVSHKWVEQRAGRGGFGARTWDVTVHSLVDRSRSTLSRDTTSVTTVRVNTSTC